VFVTS